MSASISGTVTDPQGASVSGAQVIVASAAMGIERKASTDNQGFYVVTNLPVGVYAVKVEATGFKAFEKSGYATFQTMAYLLPTFFKLEARRSQSPPRWKSVSGKLARP